MTLFRHQAIKNFANCIIYSPPGLVCWMFPNILQVCNHAPRFSSFNFIQTFHSSSAKQRWPFLIDLENLHFNKNILVGFTTEFGLLLTASSRVMSFHASTFYLMKTKLLCILLALKRFLFYRNLFLLNILVTFKVANKKTFILSLSTRKLFNIRDFCFDNFYFSLANIQLYIKVSRMSNIAVVNHMKISELLALMFKWWALSVYVSLEISDYHQLVIFKILSSDSSLIRF